MKIKKHDIISNRHYYDAICCTTNGIVKNNGELVMGGGVAKVFALNWPKLPRIAGQKVKVYGNQPFLIKIKGTSIVTFPTKENWREPSSLDLIRSSAIKLEKLTTKFRWVNVALPAPGVGLGKLKWKDVKEVLEPILDNRFTILFKE